MPEETVRFPEEIVRFDAPQEGSVSVQWNRMCGPLPAEREILLAQPIGNFCFAHCCGGTMNRALISGKDGPMRDMLFCRLCGARVRFGLSATLRDVYVWLANSHWPHRESRT